MGMRARSTPSATTRPAGMGSCSAIPVAEVSESCMIDPRPCLAADAAVTQIN
jgi:hypothetical protein